LVSVVVANGPGIEGSAAGQGPIVQAVPASIAAPPAPELAAPAAPPVPAVCPPAPAAAACPPAPEPLFGDEEELHATSAQTHAHAMPAVDREGPIISPPW
jgi:hypothetical protein